jgi:hypothetical protein
VLSEQGNDPRILGLRNESPEPITAGQHPTRPLHVPIEHWRLPTINNRPQVLGAGTPFRRTGRCREFHSAHWRVANTNSDA